MWCERVTEIEYEWYNNEIEPKFSLCDFYGNCSQPIHTLAQRRIYLIYHYMMTLVEY